MSAKEKITHNELKAGDEVEVLYQRMGDRWFAFSLINDEVFVGSLSPEELVEAKASEEPAQTAGEKRRAKVFREAGNS
jgi:hypothetical protein